MKKIFSGFLSVALCLTMVLSGALTAHAQAASGDSDVPMTSMLASSAIVLLLAGGILLTKRAAH